MDNYTKIILYYEPSMPALTPGNSCQLNRCTVVTLTELSPSLSLQTELIGMQRTTLAITAPCISRGSVNNPRPNAIHPDFSYQGPTLSRLTEFSVMHFSAFKGNLSSFQFHTKPFTLAPRHFMNIKKRVCNTLRLLSTT